MKNEKISKLTVGHIVLLVSDLQRSMYFYSQIGLPTYKSFDNTIAIIELLGGGHVLLVLKGSKDSEGMTQSSYGQLAKESFDFMLPEKSREAVVKYRDNLASLGIECSTINEEPYFGHYYFQLEDPDKNIISIYSSHKF